jgi:hypothetical protein
VSLYILVVKVDDITLEDHFKPVETLLHKTSTSFNVGSAILLGSNPDNLTRYRSISGCTPVGQAFAGGQTVTINGLNAYTISLQYAHFSSGNPALKNQREYVAGTSKSF